MTYFSAMELSQPCIHGITAGIHRVEFHAAPIRNRNRPPWDELSRDVTLKLMEAIYDTIGQAHRRGFCLFGVAVEKSRAVPGFSDSMSEVLQRKKEAQDRVKRTRGEERAKCKQELAETKALLRQLTLGVISCASERLCTQFEFFLRRFYDPDNPELQQRGTMIFDHASYERDLELLIESFRQHGTRATQIYNIIESPFFADSSSTRFLQIADFITYAIYRRFEVGDTRYFDTIAHRFDQADGICHGLTHVTSDSNCMCIGCLTRRIRKELSTQ